MNKHIKDKRKENTEEFITQPRYNKETELAILETRKIIDGSIKSKKYNSFSELMNDLNE